MKETLTTVYDLWRHDLFEYEYVLLVGYKYSNWSQRHLIFKQSAVVLGDAAAHSRRNKHGFHH